MESVTFDNKKYPLKTAVTNISNLDVLMTALTSANRKTYYLAIDTDLKNLQMLETLQDNSIAWLTDAIQTLGLLVAYADPKVVSFDTMKEAGFILAGLAEIQDRLTNGVYIFQETRSYLAEIAGKKNSR